MYHSFGFDEEGDHVRILQSCNGLLLCTGFFRCGVFRLAFDLRKSIHYKVVLAERPSGKIFESCGCLLLVCRDDIGSKDFTIYEIMKGSFVWSVRYLVNIEQLMHLLLEGWSIRTSVWSICLGEGEDDAFVVINISENVVKYNQIPKTTTEIFDIGSNQMNDDDDDDAVEFIPPFEVDHNIYEFIPSLASPNNPKSVVFFGSLCEEERNAITNVLPFAIGKLPVRQIFSMIRSIFCASPCKRSDRLVKIHAFKVKGINSGGAVTVERWRREAVIRAVKRWSSDCGAVERWW
nr:hypothetical protein [Tanacetum cinerariifolium]